MRTSVRSIAALALALGFSSIALPAPVETYSAPRSGTFFGVEGGPFWLQNLSAASGPFSVDFKFNPLWGATIPIGYDYGNGLRVSFSAGYYVSRIAGVVGNLNGSSQAAAVNGGLDFLPLMASAAYSLKLSGNLRWYLGGGVGTVYQRSSFNAFDDNAAKSITYGRLGGPTAVLGGLDGSSWHFGFQAFTGLSLDLSRDTALTLGFRFLRLNGGLSVNGNGTGSISGHSIELGLLKQL